ncbi:hypothetical protein DHEL01_v211913 [Diaporthe helianthi]|uniref:FAD-dependent oxidoreductase 2 FAD-binding domain-containing protein n=1 Tax=Diaporthe helianthi TaxID=158607 RepID=A0A2P5HHG6_DIAHE|nr:hypothetical protein DHEL01_v211913 [Diaporthe helianthi]
MSAAEQLSKDKSDPARVLIVDKCPESWAGGNSYFTAGAMRCMHGGLSDVPPLVNNVEPETAEKIDLKPGGVEFQLWDSQGIPWLRSEEYRDEVVRKTFGESIEELAENLATSEGLENAVVLVDTVREYNEAVSMHRQAYPEVHWDPTVNDGLSTQSSEKRLQVAKSNWALPLTKGPFMAIKVCCGVTFTFGGLAVDPETSGVISQATGKTIAGVYCCGEMLGGLFYENYPGGSGLTSGATFRRKAGIEAARLVLSSRRHAQTEVA